VGIDEAVSIAGAAVSAVAALVSIWQARMARSQADSARRQALSSEEQVEIMRQQLKDMRESTFLGTANYRLELLLEYVKAIRDLAYRAGVVAEEAVPNFGRATRRVVLRVFVPGQTLSAGFRLSAAFGRYEKTRQRCLSTLHRSEVEEVMAFGRQVKLQIEKISGILSNQEDGTRKPELESCSASLRKIANDVEQIISFRKE
jgi:hypothetical protein